MDPIIWHNPRCSKSRETLALITDKGFSPKVRLYLEDSPREDELKAALKKMGKKASDIIRRGEAIYKELGLEGADEERLIAAMVAHPILIERPLVIAGEKAALGRPPTDILALL